jgi:plasmid stabilization system protein ParE
VKRFIVVTSARAERDIENAARWWASERSALQAGRWLAGLRKRIASLSKSPDRCPRAAEHAKIGSDLRELHFGLGARPTHRVIFIVRADFVLILAVRHMAQDELSATDLA